MSFECLAVEEIYKKDEKIKKEDVAILQEWLKKQPHLPPLKDLQVAAFLHSCYYRIETAKITIDNYFTMRTHHPEICQPLSKEALKETHSISDIFILPKKTPKEYGIMLLRLADFNPDKYNFFHQLCTINMVTTLYLHQKGIELGAIGIFDCQGFSLGHLTRFNLSGVKTSIMFLQEAAPIRVKEIHFINMVPIAERAVGMAKPFIKSNLIHILKFHSTLDSLYEYIPKECLPEEYGGDLPPGKKLAEESLENLLENYDFFDWHYSQKVDESRRLGKSNYDYGVEGTFKKLLID